MYSITEIILTTVLAGVIGSALMLYFHLKTMKKYWPKRGFQFVSSKDVGLGGGLISNMIKGINITDIDVKFYQHLKSKKIGPCAGYLEFNKPCVFVTDLDLVRNILIKDFDHFVNRRDFHAKALDPLAEKMVFFMEGEEWKDLRNKMTPTFTTGKIRRMFQIIDQCGERLVKYLDAEIEKSSEIDMANGYGKYTVDVIATAAFGIESGAFNEVKSVFEKMAEKLQINLSPKIAATFLIIFIIPKVAEALKLTIFEPEACEFFTNTIMSAIKYRRQSGEKRDDFLQLMLEASDGQLKLEEAELNAFEKDAIDNLGKVQEKSAKVDLTDLVICAQSTLFFLAGFDTTQNVLQFAAYQLAVTQEAQEKLAKEVIASWNAEGGKFTYDSINQMEYMEKFVTETLRMYPPVPRLDRRCTKDYKIPGTDMVIPAGILAAIPSYAIHHDEEIYPDPYRFNPERFSKGAKGQRSPNTYLPFGQGPRNCIGMRFALTETKLALAHLVRNFEFHPSDKTPIPMKFARTTSLKPDGGMWVKLSPRNSSN